MTYREIASDKLAGFVGRHGSFAMTSGRTVEIAACLILALLLYVGLFPASFPFDNQNTYLLNGLASSGYGHLGEDWLANTQTPFVVFSWIIAGLNQIGFLGGTFGLSFALILLFSLSGLMIFQTSRPDERAGYGAIFLFVLLLSTIAIHSNFMLQGMAGQYALGMYLQPSEFGVLLIFSAALFVAGRRISPYVFAALAGVFHQSYLLAGAFLVISFFSYEVIFGTKVRDAMVGSVVALAIVAPVLWYSYANFAPSDAGTFDLSRRILAEFRIPHHAIPTHWFDRSQIMKVTVIVLATALSCFVNRRLAHVMASTAALGALASGAALLVGSNALFLLFPWRISVVLMPLATIVLVISIARVLVDNRWGGHLTTPRAGVVIVLLAATLSVFSFSKRLAASSIHSSADAVTGMYQDREAEYHDLVRFAREHAAEGQVYLYNPIRSFSFRIRSGMSAFVDYKSHPYRDDQVVEWWDRWRWAREVFAGQWTCTRSALDEMHDRGITHVVIDRVHDDIAAANLMGCVSGGHAAIVHDNGLYSVLEIAR